MNDSLGNWRCCVTFGSDILSAGKKSGSASAVDHRNFTFTSSQGILSMLPTVNDTQGYSLLKWLLSSCPQIIGPGFICEKLRRE
jgi:predicted short-subunit dehydrogenase-like oxidoreductase (DUF2520 family)